MPPGLTITPENTGFSDAAAARLREAQAALTDLLADAGLTGARPTELSRRLGLDKTLAWRLARFIEGADTSEAARHLPGPAGIEIVLKAAAAHRLPRPRIDAVRDADQRLREFVGRHAGDRRSFEAMLAPTGGRAPDERLLHEGRRAYFRTGAAIWGVRARIQMLMLALRPSEHEDGMLDLVQIGGLIDLERLRPDVPWIIRRLRASATDDYTRTIRTRREPLDPAAAAEHGSPIVPEYCSQPPPALSQFEANGWTYDELAPGPVGREGAVTCITGEILRSALPYRYSPDNTLGRYTLTVRTPVECVIFDLLLHRRLTHFGRASASVFGLLEDRPPTAGSAALLVGPQDAQRLGAPPIMQSPRLATYPAMVAGALEKAGWGATDQFVGYRMELDYPAAPCNLEMTCPIGET
jgi:hypothetical protein